LTQNSKPPFVISLGDRDGPEQNGVQLLTQVSDLVVNAFSDGPIHFALYGSLLNHQLIG